MVFNTQTFKVRFSIVCLLSVFVVCVNELAIEWVVY